MRSSRSASPRSPCPARDGPVDAPGERHEGEAPGALGGGPGRRLGQRGERHLPPDRRRRARPGEASPCPTRPGSTSATSRRFDDRAACLLSIGPGELSRIYRTTDAGASWTLQHTNPDPKGFLDAIAFWDADHGLALGDPVDGRFVILSDRRRRPDLGTGRRRGDARGPARARGPSPPAGPAWWSGATPTPGSGPAGRLRPASSARPTGAGPGPSRRRRSGRGSLGGRLLARLPRRRRGVAVGGDYRGRGRPGRRTSPTTGTAAGPGAGRESRPSGFRSAVAFVPGSPGPTWWPSALGLGPLARRGPDLVEAGRQGFHALGFGRPGRSGWAVGEEGRIARLTPTNLKTRWKAWNRPTEITKRRGLNHSELSEPGENRII